MKKSERKSISKDVMKENSNLTKENIAKTEQTSGKTTSMISQNDSDVDWEYEDDEFDQKPSNLMYFSAFIALLGAIGFGLGIGWSSPALQSLAEPGSSIRLIEPRDREMITWIGSSMTLGALFGALLSGFIVQKIGRRWALILYSIPFTLGWGLIISATVATMILIGRIILGLAIGALSGTVPAYLIDISTINIRGRFGALFQLFITIGILLGYTFGTLLEWRTLSSISAIPTIVLGVVMFFLPEGPNWLVANRRIDEAKATLIKLRSKNSNIETEFNEMLNEAQIADKKFNFALYAQPNHRYTLILSVLLNVFQQFCGINAVMFYSASILAESGSSISGNLGTILIGAAQVIATAIGASLVDKLGRKFLLVISGALHVFSMGVFSMYYTLVSTDNQQEATGWIPVASMIIFIIGFSIGWGPVVWLMVAEITPSDSKSATVAIATCVNWLGAFLVTKTFKNMAEFFTKKGIFMIFSGISLLSIIFTIYLLPETKNRSVAEINAYFRGQNRLTKQYSTKKNSKTTETSKTAESKFSSDKQNRQEIKIEKGKN